MTTGSGPSGPSGYWPGVQPEPQPWDPAYSYPGGPYYGYPPSYPGWSYPPPPPPAARRRRGALAVGIAAVAAATVAGVALAGGATQLITGAGAGSLTTGGSSNGGSSNGGSSNGGSSNGGSSNGGSNGGLPNGSIPGSGNGNFPFPSGRLGSGSGAKASSAEQVGVVDIVTVEDYGTGEAAGTGMIMDANGDVLTNNHVIDGATSIRVRVVSTNQTYTAKVVGTAPTKDIAVIRLVNATGLTPANFGNSTSVSVGDAVVGVGNAGGVGGTPSAARGKVTALNQTITAADENGTNSERLHGVMVTDAPIQSGDSGGPLYNAQDKVIGIDTAASTSGKSVGFAIPINTALSVAAQIEKGIQTSSIHIGYPGFLGITVAPGSNSGGALVAGVLSGGPAERAGLTGGDVITRVGNTTITGQTQLRQVISSYKPGSKVSVTYLVPGGASHTVTVTLATGPAD